MEQESKKSKLRLVFSQLMIQFIVVSSFFLQDYISFIFGALISWKCISFKVISFGLKLKEDIIWIFREIKKMKNETTERKRKRFSSKNLKSDISIDHNVISSPILWKQNKNIPKDKMNEKKFTGYLRPHNPKISILWGYNLQADAWFSIPGFIN